MAKRKSTAPPGSAPIEGAPTPADDSLAALRAAAAGCRRCELWEDATRTVFGEGPDDARVLVVGLGAIAAKAVFGSKFRLMGQRGLVQRLPDGPRAFATVHPSWVLRQRNPEEREEAWANFLDDLRLLKRRR